MRSSTPTQIASPICSSRGGVEPGDKVALSCPSVLEFPIVYYSILKAGGVVVPLNILLKGREIAYHLWLIRKRSCTSVFEEVPKYRSPSTPSPGSSRARPPIFEALIVISTRPGAPSSTLPESSL
ncbi:unnamed protein product, partial [Mesorhabditis spiculigera]